MRVHQEDIALFKDATTLPIGQQATAKVAFARRPDLKAITLMLKPCRQTVWPATASTRLMRGTPRGR